MHDFGATQFKFAWHVGLESKASFHNMSLSFLGAGAGAGFIPVQVQVL